MSERHWLWRLTYPEGRHPLGHQPYLVQREGVVWSVATDGRVIVYIAGQVGDFKPAPQPLADRLLFYFEPAGTRTGFYLGELKAFLGQAVWAVKCPTCDGRGGECTGCDGTGDVPANPRPGWLCGLPIDRNLLAMALEGLTADLVWVYALREGASPALYVVADGWRVAQSPMVPSLSGADLAEQWDNAPRLG